HGQTRWRERAAEIADLEKPSIPIVLVLGGVRQGSEANFLEFLNGLAPNEAAATIERLAAREEEQILMAAEAQAYGPGSGGPQSQGMPGQGMPGGANTPYPPQMGR